MADEKTQKTINCKRRGCEGFLCRTDGSFLFVENLEIMPKVKKNGKKNGNMYVIIECPQCGYLNRVGLKKKRAEVVRENTAPRKFLIFRSRF